MAHEGGHVTLRTCQVEVHHIAVLRGFLPTRDGTGGKEM